MAKYFVISCHVLWREFCYTASLSENSFDFNFLDQGLHNTPDILRKNLQEAIDVVPDGYDAVLMGYGLCCNGIEGVKARGTRLVFLRGHDCITFLLGSKERYKEYFDSHPGTYWYSPGWIETGTQPGKDRYEAMLKEYIEKYGEDNAEYLMKMEQGWFKEYSNAAYVDFGVGDRAVGREYTKECAEWLGWKYDQLDGDGRLMKDMLAGAWNEKEFLIVEPGQSVVASHDDEVIKIG